MALKAAKSAHGDAVRRAQDALQKVDDLFSHLNESLDPAATAKQVEDSATERFDDQVKDALGNLHAKMDALVDANQTTLENVTKEAVKASRQLGHVMRLRNREMRHAFHLMQQEQKTQARSLGYAAEDTARATVKTAWQLEKAERHAGVKEAEFEQRMGDNEYNGEAMESRAEKLREKTEHLIEHHYSRVEHDMERRMDEIINQAVKEEDLVRDTIFKARKKEQRENEEHEKQDAGSSDESSPGDEPTAEDPTAEQLGSSLALAAVPASAPGILLAFFLAFSFVVLGVAIFRAKFRSSVREQPLLG